MTDELRVARVIDAPPDVVFEAFTSKGGQEAFYGTDDPGWIVRSECDLRVGGLWTVTFGPSPDHLYHHQSVFEIVDRPRRLVLATTEHRPDRPSFDFSVEFTFEDEDGRTRMTVVQSGFPTEDLRDEHGRGVPNAFARLQRAIRASASEGQRRGVESDEAPERQDRSHGQHGLPVDAVSRGSTLRGVRVVLVPVGPEHVPELRRILRTPEVRSRWRDEAAALDWPFDDPSATRFAVLAEAEVRGMVQYGEEEDPDYRHASIDIFVDPVVHGRGVGRDAVATLAQHLIRDRGHHRLVIDPATDNGAAIRCYTAVGFRPVGVMRRYERDADGNGWHDGLLMDLLADELDPPA